MDTFHNLNLKGEYSVILISISYSKQAIRDHLKKRIKQNEIVVDVKMVETTEEYYVKVSWNGESGGEVIFKDHSLKIDTPIKYGGQGKGLCPDELFFASIAGCLTTTFLFFKRKLRLELNGLEISVQGEVESLGSKGYFIGGIRAVIRVEVNSGDEERAQRCSDLAKEYCHITRSIEGSLSIEVLSEIISD